MAKSSSRLVSLDILRGIAVAFMILVSTPGSSDHIYLFLRQSRWNGCSPADMVYPLFLFIAGVSLWYSMKNFGHELTWSSSWRIIRRTLSIFALGIFLSIFPYFRMDYSHLRIMGILQRFALAYMFAAFLCLSFRLERLWIVFAIILLLYWALLYLFGSHYPLSLGGNLVRKIDLSILGKNHIYQGFGIPFDPEGLLSTLPAAATIISGYYTGEITGRGKAGGPTVLKMIFIGIAATGLGLLWGMIFPVNRPLWTSSFVLYTAGISMICLAIVYLIADVLKFTAWGTLFSVLGTNALFSYFIMGIWSGILLLIHVTSGTAKLSLYGWLYQKVCVPVAGDIAGSLLFAFIQLVIIWLFALILFRKKIMIRF